MLALSIKNLEKTYKNGSQALKDINLEVQEGDFFALLGPNGAGKTTLIGIISTLVNKGNGSVLIFDKDLFSRPEQAKSYLGVVPQEFNFSFFETVYDIVASQAGFYGLSPKLAKQQAEKYLKALGLWEKRHQQSRILSGGMKRRLMIARALVHEPKLLILDEPTAGVDIEMRQIIWAFLRKINQQGITIILTTHYLEEAENLCRHIAIINHGEIIESTQMKFFLNRLQSETVVLYLQNSLQTAPDLKEFTSRWVDEKTLEVDLSPSQKLTDLFKLLKDESITINRMRNKRNRLEELFMRIIAEKEGRGDAN